MPTVLPLSCLKIEPMIRFSTLAAFSFFVGLASFAQAQSEVEVFSEVGDAFTLYLNQVQMNAEPAPRVLATVDPGFYQLRIDFAEAGRPDVYKNNFGAEAGMRSTGKITLNRKGEFVVRAFGFAPMSATPAQPEPTAPAPAASSTGMPSNVTMSATGGVQGSGTTTTDQVNMNVSIGGNVIPGGVNMNVQMSATESWSTTETTTQNTTQTWGEHASAPVAGSAEMSGLDFQDYLRAIQGKDFEDSKMSTAQAPLNAGAMLSSAQIAEVMKAFDYESTRLEFAVFAHGKCVDVHNYYKTHGSFEYELSIDDLNDAIGQ